jgi:hypothetical protein
LLPDPAVAGTLPELRLSNCIIRNWRPTYPAQLAGPGAVLNAGGEVWLVHCTLWGSCSRVVNSSIDLSLVENRSGILRLMNSVIWDDSNAGPFAVSGTSGMVATNCVIQGGLLGGVNTNPLLTAGGYLRSTSTACLNKVSNAWMKSDIHGVARSTLAAGAEIGAAEWVDTDADTLADWWEQFWFGNLAQTSTGDLDGDSSLNPAEYFLATPPTKDQDGDFLDDDWELRYWPDETIAFQDGLGNPDNDARNNAAEFNKGGLSGLQTDPTRVDTDYTGDSDADWLPDNWEYSKFGSLTYYTGSDDPDRDGATNLEERHYNMEPWTLDASWDGDKDDLPDWWELRAFGNKSQGKTDNPDNDELNNYQEYLLRGGFPNNYNPRKDRDPTIIDFTSTTDADADGLRDGWEIYYWKSIVPGSDGRGTPNGDPDRDGCPNLTEQTIDSNPEYRGYATQPDYNWDGDGDLFADWWELKYFATLNECLPDVDLDGDMRTNMQEWIQWRDFNHLCDPKQMDDDCDKDGDKLFDVWEKQYFEATLGAGYLAASPTGDPDGDGWDNLREQKEKYNPLVADSTDDGKDRDGMPFNWEIAYGLDPAVNDANDDPDGDGITNLQEYIRNSNPKNKDLDWDQDGLNDQSEMLIFGNCDQSASGDADGDGLTNSQEMNELGSNPANSDTAGLGFGDALMIRLGFKFNGDSDGDGLYDAAEAELGTSPFLADSDNDGVSDLNDVFPLDPALSERPVGIAGAPIVKLLLPVGIQLQP